MTSKSSILTTQYIFRPRWILSSAPCIILTINLYSSDLFFILLSWINSNFRLSNSCLVFISFTVHYLQNWLFKQTPFTFTVYPSFTNLDFILRSNRLSSIIIFTPRLKSWFYMAMTWESSLIATLRGEMIITMVMQRCFVLFGQDEIGKWWPSSAFRIITFLEIYCCT